MQKCSKIQTIQNNSDNAVDFENFRINSSYVLIAFTFYPTKSHKKNAEINNECRIIQKI
jgi:hypothetical protein